jgi:predicted CxxxxCH...CXXCH cytochrome family protein
MRGNEDGTCLTASCHNKDTGSDPSESWNTLGDLACDDCHYHAATPTALGNSGHAAPLSDDHGVHFGTGGTFVCTDCHGTVTDYTHIDGGAATAIDRANALQNESTVTVDTWNDTADSCANATCHDPSGLGGYAAVWMVSTSAGPNCALCHADTAGDPGTNRHTAHRGAAATYGLPVACADCHTLPVTANHRDGTKDVNGSKIAAWTTNCTTSCHADLAVAPTGDSPDWTTAPGAGCSTCHSNSPISGDHPVHISATQGPVTGINCGNCHAADTVNTTMTGQTTHIDGFVTFKDANILSATNACDICHGGASDANIARTNWGTASGVSCESCHDATPATIGIQAPERATNFLSVGHGLTTGNAPNLACVNCHNETSAHINGGPGDNRLDLSPTSSYNFESAGQENSFCNDCHTTAGAMSVHYDNAFKTGANDTSDDAVYCYVCHDPHGQSGFDAMIRDSIAGRTVVGFTSRTVLASYVTAAPAAGNYGVCQVCHAGEVPYYNQTTSSTTHTTTAPCTDCHFHDAGIAFEKDAAGCTACHGDGASNTWPDDSTSHEANDDGAHTAHVTAIAVHTGDPNTSCSYCHPNNGTHSIDTDYPADVCNDGSNTTKFKTLIGAAVDLLGTYDPAAKTCSNIACHATSPYTPAWYGDSVAPGAVSTFAAATGGASPPGTVFLTWKASGDDGSLDGTAYEYEVRYSENLGDLTATNFDNDPLGKTYPRAGGVPAVSRKSDIAVTQMLVDGLTPEKPYYFATRVWDEAGNVSSVVTSTQVAAQTDSVAPSFYGIEKATASDETGKVNLTWLAARDHSLPITYRVWWSTYPPQYHEDHGAALPTIKTCYNEGTPPTVAVCDDPPTFDYAIDTGTTGGLHYQVSGLTPNVLYNLLARATDSAKTYPGNTPTPNTDSNRFQKMALPITTPVMPTTMPRYYASGTSNLLKDAPGSQATGTTTIDVGQTFTWTSTTGLSATDATEEGGITFEVYIASASRVSESFDYLLGYANSSGVWQEALGLGTAKSLTVGKKAAKVFKIPLGEFHGTVPAGGNRLALRVQNASNAIIFSWGGTNKGVMTVTERNVNVVPTKPTVTTPSDPDADGIYEITWSPSVDGNSHPIHYDAYGSIDGGASYPYVIATDVCFDGSTYDPDCTPASGDETLDGLPWDTIGEGIGIPDMNGASSPANTVKVRVAAGDGYSHNEGLSATFQVDNTADNLAPARVETELALDGITVLRQGLIAEARPKQGSVSLSWTAVGNDGLNHGSRAFEYDIRYSPSSILGGDTTGEAPATITNFNNATEAHGEPFTTFSGMLESYELLGLQPGSSYYVAMRVGDESGNWSPVSNEVVVQGGPKCGICHSTPPDEPNTAGTHVKHGYTIDDCVKCHGDQVQSFALDHQDGQLLLGFGKNGDGSRMAPVEKVPGIEPTVRYIQNGFTIYEDTDGSGGFQGTGGTDSGSCSSFVGVNATGCHGSYSPTWGDTREAQCADCHGDLNRLTDPYTRDFDATIDNGMVVPDQVKASPPIDNHGYDGTGATEGERKYVGAHLVHLNASFRYAKGDNCKLCHDGYNHADGTTDIKFSLSAGDTAQWNEGTATTAGSCSGTSTEGCHGPRLPAEDPKWDSGLDITCDACHDMIAIKAVNGGIVPHTKGKGGAQVECNYCHFEGHPQNGSTNLILVPNNPTVGIAYKSGGIHLKASPGVPDLTADYGPYTYEAELCWGCHDDNGISEWGADDAPLNTATGESPYDYGNVGGVTSSWVSDLGVGATWESAKFGYKTGKIQSTHTVNPAGSSKLKAGGSNYGYFEDPDLPNRIVCSYCHDVHDMNKLAGDTTSGAPYLRGSWLANPYEEDGAPQSGQTYLAGNLYGAVPRAGTQYMQLGGYFIDQNNVVPGTATLTSNGTPDPSPTDGMTLTDTAGLCVVCHGSNVDEMDQEPGENLWLADGVHGYTSSDGQSSYWNGHSNSAIGGTAKYRSNIFDYRHGRPVPVNPTDDTKAVTTEVPSMGWQSIWEGPTTADDYAYGYRGAVSTPYYLPNAGSKAKSYSVYNWGAAVDATTTDSMFHAFSCSKCHNPHASRLPKLMITNCLDIKKNVWDNDKAVQNQWTAHQSGSRYDYGKPTAYYASAQNCHRYDDQFVPGTNGSGQAEMSGGWNKVTPWTTAP